MESLEPRRGRPRKFAAPSRAVTLTLPEHIIAALGAVDTDLSRAVVQLTQPALGRTPTPAAELSRFGNHAVIVVTPSRALAERTGIEFVPLADGRALISFGQPTTISELELLIKDAVDDLDSRYATRRYARHLPRSCGRPDARTRSRSFSGASSCSRVDGRDPARYVDGSNHRQY